MNITARAGHLFQPAPSNQLLDAPEETNDKIYDGYIYELALFLNPHHSQASTLHDAIRSNNLEWAKRLINSGANINEMDNEMKTPLHLAVAHRNTQMVELILSHGGNVNKLGWIGTPFHVAVYRGKINLVKLLIDKGAKLNIMSDRGTPLHVAAASDYIDVARYLITRGADPKIRNSEGQTLLHTAANNAAVGFCRYLIEELKFDVNALDKFKRTPLQLAV